MLGEGERIAPVQSYERDGLDEDCEVARTADELGEREG